MNSSKDRIEEKSLMKFFLAVFFIFNLIWTNISIAGSEASLNRGLIQKTEAFFQSLNPNYNRCDKELSSKKQKALGCPTHWKDQIEWQDRIFAGDHRKSFNELCKSEFQSRNHQIDLKFPKSSPQLFKNSDKYISYIKNELKISNPLLSQSIEICSGQSDYKTSEYPGTLLYQQRRLELGMQSISTDLLTIKTYLGEDLSENDCPNKDLFLNSFQKCQKQISCSKKLSLSNLADEMDQTYLRFKNLQGRISDLEDNVECIEMKASKNMNQCQNELKILEGTLLLLIHQNSWLQDNDFLRDFLSSSMSRQNKIKKYLLKQKESLLNHRQLIQETSLCLTNNPILLKKEGKTYLRGVCEPENIFQTVQQLPPANWDDLTELNPSQARDGSSVLQRKAIIEELNSQSLYYQCLDEAETDYKKMIAPFKLAGDLAVSGVLGVPGLWGKQINLVKMSAMMGAQVGYEATVNKEQWKSAYKSCLGQAMTLNSSKLEKADSNSELCTSDGQIQNRYRMNSADCFKKAVVQSVQSMPILSTANNIRKVVQETLSIKQVVSVDSKLVKTEVGRPQEFPTKSGSGNDVTYDGPERRSLESPILVLGPKSTGLGRIEGSIDYSEGFGYKKLSSVRLDSMPNLPPWIRIFSGERKNGEKFFSYEILKKDSSGKIFRKPSEFSIDSKTGALDATNNLGKDLFQELLSASQGQGHFVFFDIGSLKKINDEFQHGMISGDLTKKGIAEKILKLGNGKITLANTGGDEFCAIVHEKDPQKVQELIEKIRSEIRRDSSNPAKKVFHDEKKLRSQELKVEIEKLRKDYPNLTNNDLKALMNEIEPSGEARQLKEAGVTLKLDFINARNRLQEILKTPSPDVSIGIVPIREGETFAMMSQEAEELAKTMKATTALKWGRSAKKYGIEDEPDSLAAVKRNQLFEATIPSVNQRTNGKNISPEKSVSSFSGDETLFSELDWKSASLSEMKPVREVFRSGAQGIYEYQDSLGNRVYKSLRFSKDADGRVQSMASDIPLKGSSTLFDGNYPETKKLFNSHVSENGTSAQVRIIDFKGLREINYFQKGTQAGDIVLEALGRAIQNNTRRVDLIVKPSGGSFWISSRQLDEAHVNEINSQILRELQKDAAIKKLLKDETEVREQALKNAKNNQNQKDIENAQLRLKEINDFKFKIEFSTDTKMPSN